MSAVRRAHVAFAAAAALTLLTSACTFVKMAPGGQEVRVVGPGQLPAGCVQRGEVEVSVKDRLGPYNRDTLRVSDELETLARNEAPSLAADTVQAKGPPVDGAQRWLAFRCGGPVNVGRAPAEVDPTAPPVPVEAKTTPLKDD